VTARPAVKDKQQVQLNVQTRSGPRTPSPLQVVSDNAYQACLISVPFSRLGGVNARYVVHSPFRRVGIDRGRGRHSSRSCQQPRAEFTRQIQKSGHGVSPIESPPWRRRGAPPPTGSQLGGFCVDGCTMGALRSSGVPRRCRCGTGALKVASVAVGAIALVILAGSPVLADSGGSQGTQSGSGGQVDSGADSGQSGDGGGTHTVHGVLQCVTPNVGADGRPTSYTAVWGFAGVPNGSFKVPASWRNDVAGGSGTPPGSVAGDGNTGGVVGTWTSNFTSDSSVWHFGNETIEAARTSTPCSPAPQVPEVPTAVIAPLVAAAGLGAGLIIVRRRRRAVT
jgi:hypothetical protein